MPLRSPSGICWASANGSPDIIQEFVICESSRNPHCQRNRPSSAATSSPFSHTCLYCLPFPAGHSGQTQCHGCALASARLDAANRIAVCRAVAKHVRLDASRFGGRGKSIGCLDLSFPHRHGHRAVFAWQTSQRRGLEGCGH